MHRSGKLPNHRLTAVLKIFRSPSDDLPLLRQLRARQSHLFAEVNVHAHTHDEQRKRGEIKEVPQITKLLSEFAARSFPAFVCGIGRFHIRALSPKVDWSPQARDAVSGRT